MKLLLVRHAQSSYLSADDFSRSITEQAREELYEKLIKIKDKIGTDDIGIFSSPALRTKQTAKAFQDVLNVDGKIHEMRSIMYGDLSSTIDELEAHGHEFNIVVGHQPTMSFWMQEITGNGKPFSPATMAIIDLETKNTLFFSTIEDL